MFFAEHAEDELDYCALLNRALPEDVRVTGWGYVHESFSARFDCEFRLYKYFFCAFPDPAERAEGPLGDEGDEALSGLDLDAMRDAARRFEGTHDFRNLCKMDARNVHNYVRTVYRCDVVDAADAGAWEDGGGARGDARGARVFATKSPYVERPYVDLTPELWNLSRVPPRPVLRARRGERVFVAPSALHGRGAVPGRAAPGNPRHRRRAAGQNKVQKRKAAVRDGAGCAAGAVAVRVRARRAAPDGERRRARADAGARRAAHGREPQARGRLGGAVGESARGGGTGEGDGTGTSARARADDASGSLVAGEVVAAACALSAPGRAAGGGAAAKAAHVPLERRATEMTYEERRARIEEKEAER